MVVETSTGRRGSGRSVGRGRRSRGNPVSRLVQAVATFVRQILDELRKVVRPTGSELVNYTIVVIAFVVVIMAIVAILDLAFNRLMLLVLAG